MKIVHISDLHLGKRLNDFNLIEDQRYILNQIFDIIKEQKAQVLIIAGDVYDKGTASEEAVQLLSDFLCRLSSLNLETLIISGNHDSAVRVAFASPLLKEKGIHISPVYDGNILPITFTDQFGPVNFYLLPFIKPGNVRAVFKDKKIEDYTDAVKTAIEAMKINTTERNILVCHQSVLGASRCESEDISIGGVENVSPAVFEGFDYVALGHLHGPQKVTKETIRYSGTPLKYSISESNHKKSLTVLDVNEKGSIQISTVPLKPLHDLREIKGTYEELTNKKNLEGEALEDYLHVTLTDEEDVPDALYKLRIVYPNLIKLDYDNKRTRSEAEIQVLENPEGLSPLNLFEELYRTQNNEELNPEMKTYLEDMISTIWGNNK